MPSVEEIEILAQKREVIFAKLALIKNKAGEEVYQQERNRWVHELDWPLYRNLQAPLLEITRELGLLAEIAKYTGREIPSIELYSDEDVFEHQKAFLNDMPPVVRKWPSLENFQYAFSSGWKANLDLPVLTVDGN